VTTVYRSTLARAPKKPYSPPRVSRFTWRGEPHVPAVRVPDDETITSKR
jgi:hypothetical protein